jgi:RHH-type proline utilization regulon transcriptional repressor/proline dehydrogenase/delta 1-pyrroline-5-carboxylate dehydrogenase
LRAERNELRYHPLPRSVVLRIDGTTPREAVARAVTAATTVGALVEISLVPDTGDAAVHGVRMRPVVESDAELARRLRGAGRLRLLTRAGDDLRRAAHAENVPIDDAPVAAAAAIELPRWLRAQAVSETMHRYGNVRRRVP